MRDTLPRKRYYVSERMIRLRTALACNRIKYSHVSCGSLSEYIDTRSGIRLGIHAIKIYVLQRNSVGFRALDFTLGVASFGCMMREPKLCMRGILAYILRCERVHGRIKARKGCCLPTVQIRSML